MVLLEIDIQLGLFDIYRVYKLLDCSSSTGFVGLRYVFVRYLDDSLLELVVLDVLVVVIELGFEAYSEFLTVEQEYSYIIQLFCLEVFLLFTIFD